MPHYLRSEAALGRRMASRSPAGVWEVVGILAAVIPCGVLAGLYFATSDILFLLACFGFATVAVGLVLTRNLGKLRLPRRGERQGGAAGETTRNALGAGTEKLGAMGASLRRTFSIRILKLLGLVLWFIVWAVLVSLHLKVVENANVGGLVILVAIGAFSPILIYFGLEGGVRKLSKRMRDDV
jgi:hypothetical protein